MKKIKMLLTCALSVFLCLVLVGCSSAKENSDVSNSQFVGTWKTVKVTAVGKEVTAQEVFGGDFIMELKADGTYTMTAGTDVTTGTWTDTADGPKVYSEGNKGAVYKVTGNQMVVDVVIAKVYLEKQ